MTLTFTGTQVAMHALIAETLNSVTPAVVVHDRAVLDEVAKPRLLTGDLWMVHQASRL
ncbi:hypothetical protein [Streptomyces sp. NBC_00439]|uniref:hypothetical protein n=1 Tax=Streptomyces sp. NBC_00439 TaxID=2903650 RepID=UPI0022599B94|nr:hypothetical protein [Streptomyces sp. NBC_00439]MCX5103629.1 hypothetical protein [Streptomyces sp. NBC_00439]